MRTPSARGPLSETVLSWLHAGAPADASTARGAYELARSGFDVMQNEDLQLTLWVLYELHYAGFDDVDDRWEWSPECLEVRSWLERDLEAHLRESTAEDVRSVLESTGDVAERLFRLVEQVDSPPLAGYLQRHATRGQMLEFLTHRSIYTLKEADPHSWAIPRIGGSAKVALVELQYDEYGAGRPARQHAAMFAETLEACGLDSTYGAHLDSVPAMTLAVNNTMSLFGLHRRLRGATVGHLAAFEATSSLPARRVAMGLHRLGFPDPASAYFEEHIEADAVHEQLAMRNICGQLAHDHPELLETITFGAAACLYVDNRSARRQLDAWKQGASTLRPTGDLTEVVGA
jgi:Iron-containing redox enzyme